MHLTYGAKVHGSSHMFDIKNKLATFIQLRADSFYLVHHSTNTIISILFLLFAIMNNFVSGFHGYQTLKATAVNHIKCKPEQMPPPTIHIKITLFWKKCYILNKAMKTTYWPWTNLWLKRFSNCDSARYPPQKRVFSTASRATALTLRHSTCFIIPFRLSFWSTFSSIGDKNASRARSKTWPEKWHCFVWLTPVA